MVGLWESLVEKPEVSRFRGQVFFGEFPELPVFCNRENAFVYPNRSQLAGMISPQFRKLGMT